MARRCVCSRLFAALREDPRLATLPFQARAFFLLLAEAASRAEAPGVLPFAEPRRVSLLVSCSETEAETHIETLETEGLLRRDGRNLVVPLIADAATRAEVARRNGAAGGRPRKGETAEQALRRRQSAMLLPLAAPKPSETETRKPAAPCTTTTTEVKVIEGGSESRAPEWVSLGSELAEIAGMDGARGGYDFRPVQAWLSAGHDADAIREAVRRVATRPGYQPGRVTSLRYFHRAVTEAGPCAPAQPRRMTAAERAEEARKIREIEARVDAEILSVGRMVAA